MVRIMELKDVIHKIGEDYDLMHERFGDDDLLKKFLRMFLSDKSFEETERYYKANNYENAYASIHTLKGVVLNLGLMNYGKLVTLVCDDFKYHQPPLKPLKYREMVKEYKKIVKWLKRIE